jgi:hypothetical protein
MAENPKVNAQEYPNESDTLIPRTSRRNLDLKRIRADNKLIRLAHSHKAEEAQEPSDKPKGGMAQGLPQLTCEAAGTPGSAAYQNSGNESRPRRLE